MVREYEGWTNERLDEVLEDRKLTRVGEVTGWLDPVSIKCDVCGNVYTTTPNTLKQGSGCPECARVSRIGKRKKAKYTLKEVKETVEQYNLTVMSEKYEKMVSPLLLKCNNCEITFLRPFISIIRGFVTCPECRANIKEKGE